MSANEETIDIFGATLTRGKFVKAGGGLVVGLSLVGTGVGAKTAKAASGPSTSVDPTLPNSWLEIHPDNTIVMRTGKIELGQGSASTAYAQIAAEELNVPYTAITQVIMGDTDRTPDGGFSAGYMGAGSPSPRLAGAYVFQALLNLASSQLGVPVASLSVKDGVVTGGGKSLSYGQLVSNQQLSLTIPVAGSLQGLFGLSITGNPPVKPISQYKIVGQSIGMRTIPPIVSGTATYVGDVRLPGMLHARVVHPATLGSTLLQVGTLDKKQFPNTQIVVKGNLVAVVDPLEYNAIETASLLARTTKWSDWSGLPGSGNQFGALRKADWKTAPVQVGINVGSADAAIQTAATKLSASYEYPTEKHAPIGPTCCVADAARSDGLVYVHVHSANPQAMRWELGMMLNMSTDKIVVRNYDGSGHYGRSNGGSTGAEDEAVIISQIVGKPIRLQWMRWDDMQWSTQHTAAFSDVQAGLDSSGKLVSFNAKHYMPAMQDDRMVGALLAGLPTMTAPAVAPFPGTFGSIVNSVSDPWLYDKVPNAVQTALGTWQVGTDPTKPNFDTQIGLRGHSMRTPAQRQQNFAQESMMNELAAAAKIDPIQFRINNTSAARLIAVMNEVKTASGWETRPSPSPSAAATGSKTVTGQGFSSMLRQNSYWACAVKVSVNLKTGKVSVLNVTTAVDPGIAINPRQLMRNAEGGTVMGVSEALHEQVVFNKSKITSTDWVTFPILRMIDLPDIKVIVMNNPSVGAYGGGGEGPNGFTAAAIASAVFDATGKQPRRLPMTPKYMKNLLAT